MSLPVSQYEALLVEVRGLREKAQQVQQLATPLLSNVTSTSSSHDYLSSQYVFPGTHSLPVRYKMDPIVSSRQHNVTNHEESKNSSEDECSDVHSTKFSVSSEPVTHVNGGISSLYHGTWPVERTMWNSEPTPLGMSTAQCNRTEMTSVMSFASSSGGAPLDRFLTSPDRSRRSSQQLEAKVDMVYSLLSMLGSQEHADMGETLLALSTSPDSCLAMRQSGCIPLLVQLVQSDKNAETRKKASQALNNLIQSNPDEKFKKREARVLKLLQQMRAYMAILHNETDVDIEVIPVSEDGDNHPTQTVAHLMKLSFDEGHRQAICQLGGIHTLANLVETEHALHGSIVEEENCVLLRRYSCMALTNLTFGDSGNKALLCSFRDFMRSLVIQLQSPCDELRQVTASVLRNLSWRADSTSKEILREVGSVTGLVKAAMLQNKENTLKSILSALWNLSAHSTENKSEICAIEGAFCFLVNMLSYEAPSKSLAIVENAGGILKNISSQIAVRDDYRELLRKHNCLEVLLEQLKSSSLTIVSNACGTLWNLSAKNQTDQELLWQMGAPAMLRSLNHSKHKMIAMGSSAALKNLLASRPSHNLLPPMDVTARSMDLPILPTLGARKQKALLQELDHNLSETFDEIEKNSPTKTFIESFGSISLNKLQTCDNDVSNSGSQKALNDSFIKAFDSLAVDDPSTSFQTRTSSPSLPYTKCSTGKCYEKSLNYSLKYVENRSSGEKSNYSYTAPVVKSDDDESFGFYAETDLDEPTDYSLRYAEDDSDSEDVSTKVDKRDDFVQDTIKTYCTEGTPYETPFNFSTATSMSDLREVVSESEKQVLDNDTASKGKLKDIMSSDEKEHCSVEDISETDVKPNATVKSAKSQLSSGIGSPEKPVQYAEEGTPGYFSRVSSFGSLTSIPVNDKITEDDNKDSTIQKPSISEILTKNCEAKVVKFEQTVNYAEETPLMFSRSSSLASLDSVEQHSIHEDRESIVSDFSRLTSGIISPSELPDSPTQTIPPSPRQRKKPLEFPTSSKIVTPDTKNTNTNEDLKIEPQTSSVFEDNITKFKDENTPIQFSTATSLSSLTIDDHDNTPSSGRSDEKKKTKLESSKSNPIVENINEDVSESEEDDDILAACISEGMQTNRHRQVSSPLSKPPSRLTLKYQSKSLDPNHGCVIPKPKAHIPTGSAAASTRQSRTEVDTMHNYCTEDTPAVLSNAGSNSDLSLLTTTSNGKRDEKVYFSDDSSNLSGENDNILAECIQSAMPKARKLNSPTGQPRPSGLPIRVVPTSIPIKPFLRMDQAPSRGEYRQGIIQASSSPVSDNIGERQQLPEGLNVATNCAGASVSRVTNSQVEQNTAALEDLSFSKTVVEQNQPLSRQESLSSLSGESLGSLEHEQALLEQCISSAMPKSNNKSSSKTFSSSTALKPIGVATKQFNTSILKGVDMFDIGPKNVNVTSAVGSTIIEKNSKVHPINPNTAAGVEFAKKVSILQTTNPTMFEMGVTILQDKCLPSVETSLAGFTKSGYEQLSNTVLNCSFEEFVDNGTEKVLQQDSSSTTLEIYNVDQESQLHLKNKSNTVDNRMLDPEAMIESLDRFTAELISQAEAAHLNKGQNKTNVSVADCDTWDNDTSPNDITFPTISDSMPNVVSFQSETEDVVRTNICTINLTDDLNNHEMLSGDFSSLNSTTMIESTIIAEEAQKLAAAFKYEADMSQSITSIQSLELDCIQPPSHMNSLTCSLEQPIYRGSPKLVVRKKSLQSGLLARRALTNSLNQCSSLESLDNHSLSNLDHINPPSVMGDLLDLCDLESSMISVASLSSEVAENQTRSNPIFNVKQPYLISNELDNINPPSLFSEITDLCNSLADVPSETEPFEDCNTHFIEDDVTQFSDAQSATPGEVSSTEVSPKKTKSLSRRLTPKQRRRLAQERYRTYTVAAEMVTSGEHSTLNDFETVNCLSDYQSVNEMTNNDDLSVSLSLSVKSCSSGKSTPKQRRQNDRARYQTQVLDKAVTLALQQQNSNLEDSGVNKETKRASPSSSIPQSPQNSKLKVRCAYKKNRLENKDRFKTQTLSECSISPDISRASPPVSDNGSDLQVLVQKETCRVLKNLNNVSSHPDELLDCETLSLISNEDESHSNSGGSNNYRTFTKSDRLSFIKACREAESAKVENPVKPKITKPTTDDIVEDENPVKGIRGKRKPLYTRSTTRPVRNITSNLVNNVTSTIKSVGNLKNTTNKPTNSPVLRKLPVTQGKSLKPPSGYRSSNSRPSSVVVTKNVGYIRQVPEPAKPSTNIKKPLERQGTFTKESLEVEESKSRIPMATSTTSKTTSRIARPVSQTTSHIPNGNRTTKSATTTKMISADKTRGITFNRSSSADSTHNIKNSSSAHNLGNESKTQNGAIKRTSVSNISQRSNSSSSITSNGSTSKKQVTSKIASLWKKVEEQKKQPAKKDLRVWIKSDHDNSKSLESKDPKNVLHDQRNSNVSTVATS